jgi:hypothetical protein
MKIENIIRRVLREQEEEKLSELPPIDDFFDSDWNLVLNFMNRYPNKKFYYPGDLNLSFGNIESLAKLVRVEGYLDLRSCENLKSLGDLKYVGGWVDLRYTKIETLGNLNYVGKGLDLYGCKNFKSLGNLNYVGKWVDLRGTLISEKYTEEEIRKMVEVVYDIFMEDDED